MVDTWRSNLVAALLLAGGLADAVPTEAALHPRPSCGPVFAEDDIAGQRAAYFGQDWGLVERVDEPEPDDDSDRLIEARRAYRRWVDHQWLAAANAARIDEIRRPRRNAVTERK